jgi:hypothetical protein
MTTGKASRLRGLEGGVHRGLGGVPPLPLIAYGVHAIAMREATFGDQITMTLHGSNAIAYSTTCVTFSDTRPIMRYNFEL